MPTHAESNACSACARSKRRCGRQMPSCARCVERGWSCVYPLLRSKTASSSRPLLSAATKELMPREDGAMLAEVAGHTSSHTADSNLPDNPVLDPAFPLMDFDFSAPSLLMPTASAPATKADWFLAPETWTMSRRVDSSTAAAVGITTMKKYVSVLQSWFERWISTGSNPFVHSRLYSANFPTCVQVAYVTLASYIHRTPANADTVLQIVESRSNDLLLENGAVLNRFDADEWVDREDENVDLFAQLARLHALMVYQIIGLFDGDIRVRHVAEGHLPVQEAWAGKILHSASKTFSNTHAVAANVGLPNPYTYSQQQWYLWILSESTRRTWLVAASLRPIYTALQKRWAACAGDVMFTNRSGLWSATSATEWEKQCLRGDVGFLQRSDCARLFDKLVPADIDEFGTAMMDMTYNKDLLEKWRNERGAQ